jgi:hypothetical protein
VLSTEKECVVAFLYLIKKNGGEYRPGMCKFPKAYINMLLVDDPYTEYVWVFAMPVWAARKARAFLQTMKQVDFTYWAKQDPGTIHGWLMKIIGLEPWEEDWGKLTKDWTTWNQST